MAKLDKTVFRDPVTHELYLGLNRLLPLSADQWDQGFKKLDYHSFDERSKEGAFSIEGAGDSVIQREEVWERVFDKLKLTGQMAHGKINPIF